MMTMYRIPICERFTIVGENRLLQRSRYLVVDGIGVCVEYDKEEDLDPKNIRQHLIGLRTSHVLLEADSPERAIERFLTESHGAHAGDKGPKSKATWINKEEPILEYPPCSLLHRSRERRLICGPEEGENGNGEYGMCVLEGFDAPGFYCPMSEAKIHRATLPVDVVRGYSVQRGSKLPIPAGVGGGAT